MDQQLLDKVKAYVATYIEEKIPDLYSYHNYNHTAKVVDAVEAICHYQKEGEETRFVTSIAAWFHDVGYSGGHEEHEAASVKVMREFMKDKEVSEEQLQRIEGCILATKMPQDPKTDEEKILADADLHHLSTVWYFSDWEKIKTEIRAVHGKEMGELEWLQRNLEFFSEHKYFTRYGKEILEIKKEDNLNAMQHQIDLRTAHEATVASLKDDVAKQKEKRKADKQMKPDRGRETMLRITSRNHLELSGMADNKANIMISINSIILSIVVSVFIRKFDSNPFLIWPTFILIVVCLMTIVFAVLATRPNLTKGTFTKEDIRNKKANLVFFGNFHSVPMDDYMWGMTEMLKDSDYLYTSMLKDIYSLGVVLGRKYRLLRIAYTIFMYGFVVAVLSYVISFALAAEI